MRIFTNQRAMGGRRFTLDCNRSKRTLTIKELDERGRTDMVYRTYPMGSDYDENWTANDIVAHLRYANDYYLVKSYIR